MNNFYFLNFCNGINMENLKKKQFNQVSVTPRFYQNMGYRQNNSLQSLNSNQFRSHQYNTRNYPPKHNFPKKLHYAKVPPKEWSVICFEDYFKLTVNENQLQGFIDRMVSKAKEYDINYQAPRIVKRLLIQSVEDIKMHFENFFINNKSNFLLIGIAEDYTEVKTDDVYEHVKYYCDLLLNVVSQCFKIEFTKETPDDYFDHFLLKINSKIGGLNYLFNKETMLSMLDLDPKRTQILAIVNDSFEIEENKLQLASVVSSYDENFSHFFNGVQVEANENPRNILKSVDLLIEESVRYYYGVHKYYPENLVIFRGGKITENIENIVDIELKKIDCVLEKINSSIKLTVMLLNKKPYEKRAYISQVGQNRLLSNAIFDSRCEPFADSFDLCSHFNRIEPHMSTKYTVIRNDSMLSNEKLINLAYISCQNYFRKNHIDVPTSFRYAEQCKERSKLHINIFCKERLNEGAKDVSDIQLLIKSINNTIKVPFNLKSLPYYC
ncbi:hypothetical protein BLOT_000767 [Blomia tropicalis]|nr:hypothetical protein BLOT_000767 [Blomia tropicalis]